jgi:hypothetical protein
MAFHAAHAGLHVASRDVGRRRLRPAAATNIRGEVHTANQQIIAGCLCRPSIVASEAMVIDIPPAGVL